MNIKVIEDLEPWEVMKRASEGEPVALLLPNGFESVTMGPPSWNWEKYVYAIIDESAPMIDWDKFNWEFFNQYGGLMVNCFGREKPIFVTCTLPDESTGTPAESPMYYWPGGEQPVPDNVEVEIVFRNSISYVELAKSFDWSYGNSASDIIAFKITGNIK